MADSLAQTRLLGLQIPLPYRFPPVLLPASLVLVPVLLAAHGLGDGGVREGLDDAEQAGEDAADEGEEPEALGLEGDAGRGGGAPEREARDPRHVHDHARLQKQVHAVEGAAEHVEPVLGLEAGPGRCCRRCLRAPLLLLLPGLLRGAPAAALYVQRMRGAEGLQEAEEAEEAADERKPLSDADEGGAERLWGRRRLLPPRGQREDSPEEKVER